MCAYSPPSAFRVERAAGFVVSASTGSQTRTYACVVTSARSGTVGGTSHTTSVVDRINEIGKDRVPFSVEFYPPRDEAAEARLWRAARVFERLSPAFVSVTYGAGGSTRDRTIRVVRELARDTGGALFLQRGLADEVASAVQCDGPRESRLER